LTGSHTVYTHRPIEKMSNSSVVGQGACPTPFLDASLFPSTGGCKLSLV
jgi:hypothetical protein